MFGIYDRGKSYTSLIQNVNRYAAHEVTDCPELDNLQKYAVAIVHVDDDEWAAVIQDSCSSNVRVRVSTAGCSDPPPPTMNGNDVYVFYLVPSTDDLETEWKDILSGLSDPEVVRKLVKGEDPNGLRRFFVHEVQEQLSALVLLCEGYLAVHATDTDCHDDVDKALQHMEWSAFRNSERGKALIRENLGDKKDEVQHPMWWLQVFDLWDSEKETVIQDITKQKSFCEDVKKEWEAAGKEEVPKALKHLLEAILGNESVEPSKVADAYCVLRKKKL